MLTVKPTSSGWSEATTMLVGFTVSMSPQQL